MVTKPKINIDDNTGLRTEIDQLYGKTGQVELSSWSVNCAKHVLSHMSPGMLDINAIETGIRTIEAWQSGKASFQDVRKAGLKLHAIARLSKSGLAVQLYRTFGHAISTGHMREHAMVCSDYAISCIQLAFPGNSFRIEEERQWQLRELRRFHIDQ
jgi:hypothetical protein